MKNFSVKISLFEVELSQMVVCNSCNAKDIGLIPGKHRQTCNIKKLFTLTLHSECNVYNSVGNVYMVVNEWDATFYSESIGYWLNIFDTFRI